MKSDLSTLVYTSKSSKPMSDEDLEALLSFSRNRNTKANITGILIYSGGSFMQVLEGPSGSVKDIFYNSIVKDDRHHLIHEVYQDSIPKRNFESWTMAFRNMREYGNSIPDGFSEYLEKGFSGELVESAYGISIALLDAFKDTFNKEWN